MPAAKRIVVEIEREEGAYRAKIYGLRDGVVVPKQLLQLGPDAIVPLSAGAISLADLSRRLFPENAELAPEELASFDERTQLEIGQYLLQQLLGEFGASSDVLALVNMEGQELRIVANDEEVVRLPWVLLAHEEIMLATRRRWAVSLTHQVQGGQVTLRPRPRILLALPEPAGVPTKSAEHAAELQRLIGEQADPLCNWAQSVVSVTTWRDFRDALGKHRPDIVYFYGHGDGDLRSSALVFDSGKGERDPITMGQLATALADEAPGAVKLAYLNCCSGDAGGLLGAGMQLRSVVPAVLANRTFAWSQVAQKSAEVFLEELLLNGAPPHAAYAALCRGLFDPGALPQTGEARLRRRPVSWMTPVLHTGYDQWESAPLRRKPALPRKGTALAHFDRAPQLGMIGPLSDKLRSPAQPGSHAVLWYGGERQGVDAFHGHLRHGLALPGNAVRPLRTFSWPPELLVDSGAFDATESLVVAICELFDAFAPNQISQSLRADLQAGAQGQRFVCYVPITLPPLTPAAGGGLQARLRLLRQFFDVWDEQVAPHFEEPFVPVLGLALELPDPSAFAVAFPEWEEDLDLGALHFLPLPELGPVPPLELSNHLREAAPKLDPAQRQQAVAAILGQTAGRYDDVVALLGDEKRLAALLTDARFPIL